MQLVLSIFFIITLVSFINAQDTLRYKDFIDYERRDHFAMVENTIITRDGDFLPNGLYCFEGDKKDFELLLNTISGEYLILLIKINCKAIGRLCF